VVLLDEIAGGLTEAADRLVCLTYGRIVAEGPPAEVMASAAVQESYLGTDLVDEATP
jgi:branched-chain amino acid transport system ATP-binding protein